MESLMEINNTNKFPLSNNNPKLNKIICLFNWLDTKLIITDMHFHCIKRINLHKYVINHYFDNNYYENIDTVKQILKFYFTYSTEEQDNSYEYQFVKYRDEYEEECEKLKNEFERLYT